MGSQIPALRGPRAPRRKSEQSDWYSSLCGEERPGLAEPPGWGQLLPDITSCRKQVHVPSALWAVVPTAHEEVGLGAAKDPLSSAIVAFQEPQLITYG